MYISLYDSTVYYIIEIYYMYTFLYGTTVFVLHTYGHVQVCTYFCMIQLCITIYILKKHYTYIHISVFVFVLHTQYKFVHICVWYHCVLHDKWYITSMYIFPYGTTVYFKPEIHYKCVCFLYVVQLCMYYILEDTQVCTYFCMVQLWLYYMINTVQ